MKSTSPEINELRHRIESDQNRKMKTRSDFDFLSGVIWERTHENLSPTTLKRIWGYIDGTDNTRSSTLDILSKFLGFNDWSDFLADLDKENGSDIVQSKCIKTDDLKTDDCVAVSWKPNRRCTFRYLGKQKFIVDKAENSKLKVGNTFSCSIFILGEPLYLSDLVQDDKAPVEFVVGNKDGLCEIDII